MRKLFDFSREQMDGTHLGGTLNPFYTETSKVTIDGVT